MFERTSVRLQFLVLSCVLGLSGPAAAASPFHDAEAVWQMANLKDSAGKNGLAVVGNVTVGEKLQGKDWEESLACGNDGLVAQFDGGYLDAGQGTGGALNITGSALTVSVRLRNPSGVWGSPLFSKYGGHDRLVYNLYSLPSEIGFELGTQGTAGAWRTTVPVATIGASQWHTVICRYDGSRLQMFVDGVLMDEDSPHGSLREGNTEPCLIGAEAIGGKVKAGWKGEMDHVALWKRALSDAEIAQLSGGTERITAARKRFEEIHLLPPRADLYREALRPQFHFTARQWTTRKLNPGMREEGWLNDLNGLVYYAGEFHLFAQRWNKCWIHAVSTDLVHWTELQPAFWEDHRFGSGVQSGGAVIDFRNTSGLSPDAKTPPMVAFWAGNDNFSTCISYSLDKGRTWTKYAKNPVLRHPERDPKVFWYEPTKRWVLVLSDNGHYSLFTSPNLLDWTDSKASVPESFECPDMFQLPVAGDPRRQKWVLVRGNGRYSLGKFDGVRFQEEAGQFPCDSGPNFYATMSWGDIAGQPGRRVQVAWMNCQDRNIYRDMPFNQQVTFPCDMTLRDLNGSLRIFRNPVHEIELLHRKKHAWKDLNLKPGVARPLEVSGGLYRIRAEVDVPQGSELAFHIRGTSVVIADRSIACNSRPAPTAGGVRKVEILVDRASIESFANDGEVSVSTCFRPTSDSLAVECTKGSATIRSLEIFELESIWKGSPACALPAADGKVTLGSLLEELCQHRTRQVCHAGKIQKQTMAVWPVSHSEQLIADLVDGRFIENLVFAKAHHDQVAVLSNLQITIAQHETPPYPRSSFSCRSWSSSRPLSCHPWPALSSCRS